MFTQFLSLAALWILANAAPVVDSRLTVRASTNVLTGRINENFTDVREFLDVPFGMSTAGKNRFMPPKAVPMTNQMHDATEFGPVCPQYVTKIPAIWNEEVPQYLQYWGNANYSAGESAAFASEDCLKLAIWTPANATSASNLPVAMFWTGGGFQTNGIQVPGQLPPRWIHRSQSHIVVTINYRMNIMGFPNAAGAYDTNLGLLDQRMALEWVRDNIKYFGGDSGRIMVWGQSAGASSVDYYQYAHWEDPIAHAFWAESGSVIAFPTSDADVDHTNFTTVAKHMGCDYPGDGAKELSCMQKVDYNKIINFMGQYQDNSTLVNPQQPQLSFTAIPDQRTVFSNYTERYLTGMVSKTPMIYSSTANEGGAFVPFPAVDPMRSPNQTAANLMTTSILCGAAMSGMLRDSIGLPTYRYQYAGNWTNQDPLPWMGAFHSSDLVIIFGSYNSGPGVKLSMQPLEAETSAALQDHVLAYVRDPWTAGDWPRYNTSAPNGGTLLRFGADGQAVQEVDASEVEAVCSGKGPYNPFP